MKKVFEFTPWQIELLKRGIAAHHRFHEINVKQSTISSKNKEILINYLRDLEEVQNILYGRKLKR